MDNYEKFLTGAMSARRLAEVEGLEDSANTIVPMLHGLSAAHDGIVYREARRLVVNLIKALKDGRIAAGKPPLQAVAALLELDQSELEFLQQALGSL